MNKNKSLGVPPRSSGSRVAGVPSAKKPTARSSRPSTRSRANARAYDILCIPSNRAESDKVLNALEKNGVQQSPRFMAVYGYMRRGTIVLEEDGFWRGLSPTISKKVTVDEFLKNLKRPALGIGAKPTKEAVRRTGAKRSGAKPGASRATPKKKRA